MLFISIFILDIYNIIIIKTKRKVLLITSILIMAVFLGFVIVEKGTNLFQGLNLIILILIVLGGIVAFATALKKDKEEKQGMPADDEFSLQLKYKSGYYAYMASLYMWLFIFLFKGYFPDVETMLGGGILLSALIGFISKYIVKQQFHEK